MNYEHCNGFTHTIKKGDTLYEISRKHNVPLALLLRANPYIDVFNLQAGDTICIPSENNQMVPYPLNTMPCRENCGENGREAAEEMTGETADGSVSADMPDDDKREAEGNIEAVRDAVSTVNTGNTSGSATTERAGAAMVPVQGVWIKYVVQPGDTMEDIMSQMDGSMEEFAEKNGLSSIYMLPGLAYYIKKEKNE